MSTTSLLRSRHKWPSVFCRLMLYDSRFVGPSYVFFDGLFEKLEALEFRFITIVHLILHHSKETLLSKVVTIHKDRLSYSFVFHARIAIHSPNGIRGHWGSVRRPCHRTCPGWGASCIPPMEMTRCSSIRPVVREIWFCATPPIIPDVFRDDKAVRYLHDTLFFAACDGWFFSYIGSWLTH